MGMFDTVDIKPGLFFCSEGHDLAEHGESAAGDLQTKDFNCTMGSIQIAADRSVTQVEGPLGMAMEDCELVASQFNCYTSCAACPAFVSENHVHLVWCEFVVTIQNHQVTQIQYVSDTTTAFLEKEPKAATYTNGTPRHLDGPMPYADAIRIRNERWALRAELQDLHARTVAHLHDAGDEQPGTVHVYFHAGHPPRTDCSANLCDCGKPHTDQTAR